MQATILSYLQGMSGDFISALIHQNPGYYDINLVNNDPLNKFSVSTSNRYFFPNMLFPINRESKIWNRESWNITSDDLRTLNDYYGGAKLILPTHWYNKITPETTGGLFNKGIKLYCLDNRYRLYAYTLWWVKSHINANEPWLERVLDLGRLVEQKPHVAHLYDNFHNWKFMSYKHNILKHGEPDLLTYITQFYKRLYKFNDLLPKKYDNYMYLDVDNILYNDMSNIDMLEQHMDVSISRSAVKEYTEKNMSLLNTIHNGHFEEDDKFFHNLYEYVKNNIVDLPIAKDVIAEARRRRGKLC